MRIQKHFGAQKSSSHQLLVLGGCLSMSVRASVCIIRFVFVFHGSLVLAICNPMSRQATAMADLVRTFSSVVAFESAQVTWFWHLKR
jgi:hypothetical protein